MTDTSKRVGSAWPDPPKQQPYRYGRRNDGRYAMVPWASLTQDQIDAMAAQADANGLNYEVTNNFGGRSEIFIEYPYNFAQNSFPSLQTEVEETWEIVPQMVMKNLLDSSSPFVSSFINDADFVRDLNLLQKWHRQNTLETYLVTTSGDYFPPTHPGYPNPPDGFSPDPTVYTPFTNAGKILAKFLYDGVDQVEVPAPVLTRTRCVTEKYIHPASFANVGYIFSSSTLISSEGVPSAVLFDFPNDTDPAPVPIGVTGLFQIFGWGWLKKSPSVRQIAKRKWNITQAWDYGLWAVQLYHGVRL